MSWETAKGKNRIIGVCKICGNSGMELRYYKTELVCVACFQDRENQAKEKQTQEDRVKIQDKFRKWTTTSVT